MTLLAGQIRAALAAVVLGCVLAGGPAGPLVAQTATGAGDQTGSASTDSSSTGGQTATGQTATGQTAPASVGANTGGAEGSGPDYGAWDKIASRAETLTDDPATTDEALQSLRAQVADWRASFLAAQSTNAARISTLRGQIDALGPAPAEGTTEAPEIAARRGELTDQLVRLQAPGIAADEAHRRADGLIREIDRQLRERQTSEMLQLWPTPMNPKNWPAGVTALTSAASRVWTETDRQWNRSTDRESLKGNLPLILLLLVVGIAFIWRGRKVMELLSAGVRNHATSRWMPIGALMTSLGQVVLPTAGFRLVSEAMVRTSMLGPIGLQLAQILPLVGFSIFGAMWLGSRVFPKIETPNMPFQLPPERRKEGRLLASAFGALIALEFVRDVAVQTTGAGEDAKSVLSFPVIVLGGAILIRMGQLLRKHVANQAASNEQASFRNALLGLVGRGAMAIGVLGPVLAAIGYVAAAGALVFPAAMTLGLLGLLFVVQQLVDDVYGILVGRQTAAEDALAPTLIGFGLALASLPLFALIWGARTSDIAELWTRFLEGFSIGETHISPSAFLTFALIFALGYMVTRLVQSALRISVLPKTKLDQGGKNAVVAGLGYVGIFLSALIAINSAGINLAGFAVVAGALSVGIGFGLQNIVSNFVSGIILLIERPVSEGDWIEVGGVQGTVQSISVRSTRIQTFDRTDVIVPNSDLIAGQVTNWTRFSLTGRLIVPVGVGYDSDTRKVERILLEIAEAQPLVVVNPPPSVLFVGLGADSMNFEIRVILRDVNFSLSVRSAIYHEVIARFRDEGIAIPFPQRDVWLRTPPEAGATAQVAPEPPVAQRAPARDDVPGEANMDTEDR